MTYEELVNHLTVIRRAIVLTKSARLLSEQGEQSAYLDHNNEVQCFYKDDGRHCAIGILLDDVDYEMPPENCTVSDIPEHFIKAIDLDSKNDINFAEALQRAHDTAMYDEDTELACIHDSTKDGPFYPYFRRKIEKTVVDEMFEIDA